MTLAAYLMVLGPATLAFDVAYWTIPDEDVSLPTRFLIVVELGLAILGAVGLRGSARTCGARKDARIPALIVAAICIGTAFDLFLPSRGNPMVPGDVWLAPPHSADVVRAGSARPRARRTTPVCTRAFVTAHGWADVAPYFQLRDFLQPNIGGFENPRTVTPASRRAGMDVWGDHNREDPERLTRVSSGRARCTSIRRCRI